MANFNNLGRGLDDLIARARKCVDADASDHLAEQYARDAASIIQRRTRGGEGVSSDFGQVQSLAPLSPSYIARRKQSRLSAFTSPARSNLTFSGEMLGSLQVGQRSRGRWVVTLEGVRDSGLTNAKLAKYVSRARPFMFLARTEVDELSKRYERNFEALVKKNK